MTRPDLPDPPAAVLADPAFLAVLSFCARYAPFVLAMDGLCGTALGTPLTGLDAAVDRATGREDADARLFVAVVYDLVWLRMPDGVSP